MGVLGLGLWVPGVPELLSLPACRCRMLLKCGLSRHCFECLLLVRFCAKCTHSQRLRKPSSCPVRWVSVSHSQMGRGKPERLVDFSVVKSCTRSCAQVFWLHALCSWVTRELIAFTSSGLSSSGGFLRGGRLLQRVQLFGGPGHMDPRTTTSSLTSTERSASSDRGVLC